MYPCIVEDIEIGGKGKAKLELKGSQWSDFTDRIRFEPRNSGNLHVLRQNLLTRKEKHNYLLIYEEMSERKN